MDLDGTNKGLPGLYAAGEVQWSVPRGSTAILPEVEVEFGAEPRLSEEEEWKKVRVRELTLVRQGNRRLSPIHASVGGL